MPSLGLGHSCCHGSPLRDRVPFGASLASYSALLGSAGFISMLSLSHLVLRFHLGCLRTCWIELSLQRELDFALLQELRFGPLFGHLLTHACILFVAKRTSGAHLVPL